VRRQPRPGESYPYVWQSGTTTELSAVVGADAHFSAATGTAVLLTPMETGNAPVAPAVALLGIGLGLLGAAQRRAPDARMLRP